MELNYRSGSIDKEREALVYLPPGYDGSADWGGHTAEVWSRYLHELAPQLFASE